MFEADKNTPLEYRLKKYLSDEFYHFSTSIFRSYRLLDTDLFVLLKTLSHNNNGKKNVGL